MSLVFLLIRLLLTLIFVVTGFTRLTDLVRSRQTLRDLGVPAKLAAPLSILLALAELTIAVALCLALTAWWAALAACALLLLSVIGISYNLARRRLPERHDGDQLPRGTIGWPRLGRNLILAAIAGFVVWQWSQNAGPGLLDWLALLSTTQRVELLVAVILCALLLLEGWVQFHALSQQGRMLLRIEALEGQGQTANDAVEILSHKNSVDAMTDLSGDNLALLPSPLSIANEEVEGASTPTSVNAQLTDALSLPTSDTKLRSEVSVSMNVAAPDAGRHKALPFGAENVNGYQYPPTIQVVKPNAASRSSSLHVVPCF